jgi:hypothetical protein
MLLLGACFQFAYLRHLLGKTPSGKTHERFVEELLRGLMSSMIYRGLQLIDFQIMLAGAIPAGLLAVLLEVVLSLLERKLSRAAAER